MTNGNEHNRHLGKGNECWCTYWYLISDEILEERKEEIIQKGFTKNNITAFNQK